MTTDGELLRCYTETHSESAFAELVGRHLNLVYSAALRQVNGDAHLAEDVAQTVFADLARKAASLASRPVLNGWLYTSAHFAAAKAVRTERRRHTREEEAQLMNQLLSDPAPDLDWEKLRPVLDAAMLELNEADREAVLLRYFDNRPHAEIADRLGLSENAARMRVDRALEKLRTLLGRRGVSTTAALAAVISANAVQVAPAGLAATLSTAALAGTTLTTAATVIVTKAIAMTTLQKTLIASAIIAVVGVAIFKVRRESGSPIPSEASEPSSVAQASAAMRGASSTNLPVRATVFTRIYSPDTKQFAANLRAIKCPEETVKDIIVAEVNRKHRTQEDALRPKPADHVPFMWSANPSERALLERRQQAAALARVKAAALREALGYDVPVAMPVYAMRSSDQRLEEQLGNLAPDQRSAIRKARDDYWTKVQVLQDRTKGFWQSDDVAELEQLKRNYRDIVEPLLQSQSAAQATAVTEEQSKNPAPAADHQADAVLASATAAVAEFNFDWAAVETSDYKQYAANLRTLGFPEELLRTIITADVNKLYAAREEPLKPKPVPYDAPLSERQKPVSEAHWERIKQLREVQIEKQTVLQEIFGVYVPREILHTGRSLNYESYEHAIGLLPPEKRNAVQLAQEDYVLAEARSTTTMTNRAAELENYKRLRVERDAALQKILTPEEFDRFNMNTTPAGTELARCVIGMEPTNEEFETMFKIVYKNWLDTGGVYGRYRAVRVSPEQIAAANQEMEASLTSALGPERYLDYQLATSESGQQLRNLAARYELPRDVLAQAFEVQSEADRLGRGQVDEIVRPDGSKAFVMRPLPQRQELQDRLQMILGPVAWQAWTDGRTRRAKLDP